MCGLKKRDCLRLTETPSSLVSSSKADWADLSPSLAESDSPDLRVALVLGPVNGANNCKYTAHILDQLQAEGFRAVFSHYRNFKIAQDKKNVLPGDQKSNFVDFTSVEDVDLVIKHVHQRYPKANIYLVGFSMGAIQAIKWVGQNKGQQIVKGVVSVSCPIDLSKASPELSKPKHWVYARWMTGSLINMALYNKDLIEEKGLKVDFCKTGSRSRGRKGQDSSRI